MERSNLPRFGWSKGRSTYPGHPSYEQLFVCCQRAVSIPWPWGTAGIVGRAEGGRRRTSPALLLLLARSHLSQLCWAERSNRFMAPLSLQLRQAESPILSEERCCPSPAAAPTISAPHRVSHPCAVLVQGPSQSMVPAGHPKASISFPLKWKPAARGQEWVWMPERWAEAEAACVMGGLSPGGPRAGDKGGP